LLPRVVRALTVAAVTASAAAAVGDQGFWLCVPGVVLLAGAERSPRTGGAAAALVVAAAAAVAPPAAVPAAIAMPLAILVLLSGKLRLERERDQMRRYALRDPLTGVFNRRALDGRLEHEMARHRRQGESFTVLVLDLDGFKRVNDRFGHEAGDDVLREVARALVGAVREQDTVARLGGDEFCVVAPETSERGAGGLVARIDQALAGVTAGISGVSASIGLAEFPADGARAPELLAVADQAALDAKRARRMRRAARAA
jgi:diguanylate cyclase (GGDEF)-like protein